MIFLINLAFLVLDYYLFSITKKHFDSNIYIISTLSVIWSIYFRFIFKNWSPSGIVGGTIIGIGIPLVIMLFLFFFSIVNIVEIALKAAFSFIFSAAVLIGYDGFIKY